MKIQKISAIFKPYIAVTDLILLGGLIILALISQNKEMSLIILSISTILYIVFGENFEKTLGKNIPRKEGSREWVASLSLGGVLLVLGFVDFKSIQNVIYEKWEIIGLIMSFALMSYGIGKSGYFKYAAYRITESCGGSTTRLTLYLFVLTSILTLITSNDIVILVLTPIIIQIAYYAGIKNAKLLLLSQFVAANTLSMGLLIGSPTNIIFGTVLGYDFMDYIALMIVPTIVAFMVSFIIVHLINKYKLNGNPSEWSFNKRYILPTIDKKQNHTIEMTYWLGGFAFVVLLTAFTTSANMSLGWVILGVIVIVLAIYAYSGRKNGEVNHVKTHLVKSVKDLPFQIIPFALVFFVITEELSNSDLGTTIGTWIVSSDSYYLTTLKSLLVSGGLVNLFNDLPAAAFLSNVIDPNMAGKDMVARALLVGLNIGCYVTPIGALAGIIWFHQMKNETDKIVSKDKNFNIQTPGRSGLFKYGMIHFVAVVIVLSFVLPAISHLHNISISQWALPYTQGDWIIQSVTGVLIISIVIISFNHILQKNNVVLGDMRVFLGFMTWANARNKEHSIGMFVLFFMIVIALFTVPIFRAEDWGLSKLVWIPNMIGGGFEFPQGSGIEPKTVIGVMLIGILPLASIALLVKLISALSNNEQLEGISFKMAAGEIQSHRVVVVMDFYEKINMDFIGNILAFKNNTFVTILINQNDKTEVQEFLKKQKMDIKSSEHCYIDILPKSDIADVVLKFNIEKADEVYLFSSKKTSKLIAKSLQKKLYAQGNFKLKDNERCPKIFSANEVFDNESVKSKYVISLPTTTQAFEKIEKAIYHNNLECNNHKYLVELVGQG
ncbi:Arsenic efflux pump protein [uncultured Candidatus Thioglobus sp.]|nr:Arsenic efflux pump protein [uncultured Candidatus Thioglobus sp.]